MSPIPILLVEDDPLVAESIVAAVQDAGWPVAGTVASGEEAMAFVDQESPPVVLMDIQLAGAMDGIDTARELRRMYPCVLLFLSEVTDPQTLKRMQPLEPYFFMPKPVTAFQVASLLRQEVPKQQAALSAHGAPIPRSEGPAAPKPSATEDSIYLRIQHKEIRVRLADIIYLQAHDKYCKVFTRGTATYRLASNTMGKVLTQLQERAGGEQFVQIHRSYAVNWAYVQARSGNELELKDVEKPLMVGRSYREAIFSRMQ